MKRSYFLLVLMAVASLACAQSLFVGTYNIRNHNSGDDAAGNVWNVRCKVICDQINFEDPDIFGTQEVLHAQLGDLTAALDGYDYIGVGRDDGKQAGEYSAIFYKKDRIKLLRKVNFWLNETPDTPKLGWDAACIRICTWGEFRQKDTKFKFYYFNLHMDHVGVTARREGAKLVVRKIKEIAKGAPVNLTGDFNVDQNDEIYAIFSKSGILKDSYECCRLRFAENGTFNSFDSDLKSDSRCDHVVVSPSFVVDRYGVLTIAYWTPKAGSENQSLKGKDAPGEISFGKYDRRTPSAHYPVLVKKRYAGKSLPPCVTYASRADMAPRLACVSPGVFCPPSEPVRRPGMTSLRCLPVSAGESRIRLLCVSLRAACIQVMKNPASRCARSFHGVRYAVILLSCPALRAFSSSFPSAPPMQPRSAGRVCANVSIPLPIPRMPLCCVPILL